VIPDQFDYDVVLQPEGHRVGTLNEDFAFESLPGDIFQLGNASYRIAKVETGKVLVEDARGQPPTMPFWLGESLGRTDELCEAVSRLCETAGHPAWSRACRPASAGCAMRCTCRKRRRSSSRCTWRQRARRWACCPAGAASCSSASSTRWATRTW
jgi:ATP-dependent Lhr-like helicase